MNLHRTPALAHVFTRIPSRRDVLRGLAGIGLAALQSPDPGDAKRKRKRKKKKHCPPCKRRKKGKCKGTLRDGTPCGECMECRSGACVAKADGTPCPGGTCQGGACQTDPCPGRQLCEGECIPTDQCCTDEDCPGGAGERCCNGACTDEKREPGSDCGQNSQCCSDYCRTITVGRMTCAATCRGKYCAQDSECCRGFACQGSSCGGCGDYDAFCVSEADCCFSACTALAGQSSKSCQSYAGGPCEKNYDCWPCRVYNDCTVTTNGATRDICQNGVCGCPDECCADGDCAPAEFCAFDQYGLRGECKPRVGP